MFAFGTMEESSSLMPIPDSNNALAPITHGFLLTAGGVKASASVTDSAQAILFKAMKDLVLGFRVLKLGKKFT